MSHFAAELDKRLLQLDPRTAAQVEQLIREALALAEAVPGRTEPAGGLSFSNHRLGTGEGRTFSRDEIYDEDGR